MTSARDRIKRLRRPEGRHPTDDVNVAIDPEWPKDGTHEVFKLQRELSGGKGILIYNKDKSIMSEFGSSLQLLKMFGREAKIYVTATLVKDDSEKTGGPGKYKIVIRARVREPNW